MVGIVSEREWDATSYERISDPMAGWGRAVLGRLELRGDETALDAGCGTGRVTRMLAERLPEGRVLAVDASAAMVEEAATRLADLGARVRVERVDLLELELPERVEIILSTATFHWILDHDRLFHRLAGAIAPGGRMEAQCGGAGNVADVLEAVDEVITDPRFTAVRAMEPAWNFATPDLTTGRLEAAGFTEVTAWLEPAPVDLAPGPEAEVYLRTVVLRLHVLALDEELRGPFVRAVAHQLNGDHGDGPMHIDYVRLNISARGPGTGR
jgi:trans-aconitate 2-methyltransferase